MTFEAAWSKPCDLFQVIESDVPMSPQPMSPAEDLLAFARGRRFQTILADPPWQHLFSEALST